MDKITKLLKKISPQDRTALLNLVEKLIAGDKDLDVVKLKNSDFYRLRKGSFRIIFHKTNHVIIDSIRSRNDNTYKKL